jgi:hypothetical protein
MRRNASRCQAGGPSRRPYRVHCEPIQITGQLFASANPPTAREITLSSDRATYETFAPGPIFAKKIVEEEPVREIGHIVP